MATIMWGREMAEAYDASVASRFDPHDVDSSATLLRIGTCDPRSST
ncbi:hypothetical protein [Ilumatobacter sp.]